MIKIFKDDSNLDDYDSNLDPYDANNDPDSTNGYDPD